MALVRDARVSRAKLRVILELSPEVRRAMINLVIAPGPNHDDVTSWCT